MKKRKSRAIHSQVIKTVTQERVKVGETNSITPSIHFSSRKFILVLSSPYLSSPMDQHSWKKTSTDKKRRRHTSAGGNTNICKHGREPIYY